MNEKLFITFVILNIVNVIIQTVKSLATVKCGKVVASIVNAIAYGLYTVVVVYTVCDLPLWLKVVVVGLSNLVGVFVVKLIEEKSRQEKLWKIEATIQGIEAYEDLYFEGISCNCLNTSKKGEFIVNCFCPTKEDCRKAKAILDKRNAKYFVTETKNL